MSTIISGHDVVRWVESRMPWPFVGEAIGLGLMGADGRIVCGVVLNNRTNHDAHIHLASERGGFSRRFLRAIADYAYNQLGVRRMTVCIRSSNTASISVTERVGFVLEGRQRSAYPNGEDKLLFGMLREECQWLSASGAKDGNMNECHPST